MKKRIVAIIIAVMACVSLLAVPISALAVGDSNYKAPVVESPKTADIANAISADTTSTKPVDVATIKSSSGEEIAKIDIIPANAPQIANMTQAELSSAIAVITDVVSTVSTAPSARVATAIETIKAATSGAVIKPISFGTNVTFAFPVQVSVSVDKSTPAGKYTVYAVEDSGKITLAGTANVDSNGVAKFSISRSAEYFLSNKVLNV